MNDAMARQIGGTHYKGMQIEPFEFGHANGYDAETFSIMKYVSRHHLKNGAEDLKKALHIVDIRLVQLAKWGSSTMARERISVDEFIEKNQIGLPEAAILSVLHKWACGWNPHHEVHAETLRRELKALIATLEKES